MSKWLAVAVLALLVLTSAMGLKAVTTHALAANTGAPPPPAGWLVANTGAPPPPAGWLNTGAPPPPAGW